MVGTRLENGQLQNSSSGNTMGTERLQEKARTTEEELVGRHQTRPQKYGLDVGRSRDNGIGIAIGIGLLSGVEYGKAVCYRQRYLLCS